MLENDEKRLYSHRLEEQIRALDEILSLNDNGLLDGKRERLKKLQEQAKNLKRKIDTGEFEIAVIGLEKSGKSTFANALMQNDILPSDNERCTYTASSIEYSNEGASAVVEFMTENEFYTGFNEKIKMIGIENPDSYTLPDTTESKYETAVEKVEEKLKKIGGKINKNLNEDILNIIKNKQSLLALCRGERTKSFYGDELTSEEFRNLICAPEQAVAVKKITIKTDKFKSMPNAVLYDVPGFDSPTTLHKKQTKEFMNKADAIVLVSRANEPSFKETEMNLFDDYKNETDDDETILADKMFPFANKVDIVEANKGRTWDEQVARNLTVLEGELKKYCNFTKVDRIVIGSAFRHLFNKEGVNGRSNGVNEIKEKLEHYYNTERFEILKRRVSGYEKRIKEVCEEIKEENPDIVSESNFDDYGIILQKLTKKNKSISKALDHYKKKLAEDYNADPIISRDVETKIAEEISNNKFVIIDKANSDSNCDETNNTGNMPQSQTFSKDDAEVIDTVDTSDIDNPEATEKNLRDKMFNAIYDRFASDIVALAEHYHMKCDNEIRRIVIDNLVGEETCTNAIETAVDNYIKSQKNANDGRGYYKSLVERFSRDLFEILIKYPYGLVGRWNKFDKERDIFYSLAMFDKRKADKVAVEKQPLFYSLLFHDTDRFAKYDIIKDVLDDIKIVLDFVPTPKIVDMVARLAFSDKTADVIKKLYNTIQKNANNKEQQLEAKLKMQPQNVNMQQAKKTEGTESSLVPNEITEMNYNTYFVDKRNKKGKKIISDIQIDIDILHDVIKNVVVRAIRIEKPFLTLQFDNIDKLKKSLEEDTWDAFVRKNLPLFRATDYSSLAEKEQRRIAHKEVMDRIDSILKAMNNPSTQNNEN